MLREKRGGSLTVTTSLRLEIRSLVPKCCGFASPITNAELLIRIESRTCGFHEDSMENAALIGTCLGKVQENLGTMNAYTVEARSGCGCTARCSQGL
jgi:hypothetical protein